MTELLDAIADASPDADAKRLSRVAVALYEAAQANKKRGWQKALAEATGLSRETIRSHIEDERIRRGEIPPTPRYLKAQARKQARVARES